MYVCIYNVVWNVVDLGVDCLEFVFEMFMYEIEVVLFGVL